MKTTNPFLNYLNGINIEKEIDFFPKIPVGNDMKPPKYTFSISEHYHDRLDEQIFLDIMYDDREDTSCSFLLSPEDVLTLAHELLDVYKFSMMHKNMKQQRRYDIKVLESMINNKTVSKILLDIDYVPLSGKNNEFPEFLVNVYAYRDDCKDYDDFVLAYNFRLNLFRKLYAYVQNILKNNKKDSLNVVVDKNGTEVSAVEMIKRDFMYHVVKDMDINISLYPDKTLDNLFQFHGDIDEFILDSINEMIVIVEGDNQRTLENLDKIIDTKSNKEG